MPCIKLHGLAEPPQGTIRHCDYLAIRLPIYRWRASRKFNSCIHNISRFDTFAKFHCLIRRCDQCRGSNERIIIFIYGPFGKSYYREKRLYLFHKLYDIQLHTTD